MKHRVGGPALIFIIVVMLAGAGAPLVCPHDPYLTDLSQKFLPMSLTYPLGTDHLGRCILSRLVYGVRPTLFYAFLAMLGTMGLGTLFGLAAGYFSNMVDDLIMALINILLSFPSQVMIFAIVALIGPDIKNVVIATIIIKWAWYARVIRTSVLKYKNANFILFSKVVGTRPSYILTKHILPNVAPELAVLATLDLGWSIINISTLSFLGLGVQPPTPEWGAMLSEAKQVIQVNPIQMFVPGLAITSVVIAFNLIGDTISEMFNPKEVHYE